MTAPWTADQEFSFRHAYNYASDVTGLYMDDAERYGHWVVETFEPDWGSTDYSHQTAMKYFLEAHPDVVERNEF